MWTSSTSRFRRLAVASLALAALALAACDGGGPDPIGITGTWEGEITDGQDASVRYPITLRLTDNGQTVNGTGEVELPGERFAFRIVNGSFVSGIVQLPLHFDQTPFQGSLSGQLTNRDPGQITGTFSGRNQANGPVFVELVAR